MCVSVFYQRDLHEELSCLLRAPPESGLDADADQIELAHPWLTGAGLDVGSLERLLPDGFIES